MSNFLAVSACATAFCVCFLLLKRTQGKKTIQMYPHGGKLTMEQGKFYDVSFGYSGHRVQMQLTGAQFLFDKDGFDATVKFDSRPKQKGMVLYACERL